MDHLQFDVYGILGEEGTDVGKSKIQARARGSQTEAHSTDTLTQAKGGVSGVTGEEERLLTVLYFDWMEHKSTKGKGKHDDESD
jgi:hypothetical protein